MPRECSSVCRCVVALALLMAGSVGAQDEIFQDGFETGDASAWSLVQPPLAQSIGTTSPAQAEVAVALTRETIVSFLAPLDPASLDAEAIFAVADEVELPATQHLSADGRRVTLFYDPPLPEGSEVRVTIDGDRLRNDNGQLVDANGDGHPGGLRVLTFHTLGLGTVPGTRVCGRVLASEPSTEGVDVPLEGVTVSVDGVEDVYSAITDAVGNYCLDPSPSERFFVHIDGATATNPVPPGAYYPTVGKAFEPKPGLTQHVGESFLPLIADGTLQAVSEVDDASIALPPEVLAARPELAGAELLVPAGSLFFDDLQPGTVAGLAPVLSDRLPGQLPADLDFPVVFTVQTGGANNFDVPAPICFPNLPQPGTGVPLPAGSGQSLISFDHDAGRWRVVGGMTVTGDGRICSNAGVGILAPGWHLPSPPPIFPPHPPVPTPPPGPHPPHVSPPPTPDPPTDPPAQPGDPDPPCNGGSTAACSAGCQKTETVCDYTMVGIGIGCAGAIALGIPTGGLLSFVVGAYCGLGTGAGSIHGCGGAATSCQNACDAACGESAAESFGAELSPDFLGRSAGGDPVLAELMDISNQIAALVEPYRFSGIPVPEGTVTQLEALLDQAEVAAGGDPIAYAKSAAATAWVEVEPSIPSGNSPHYPILYLAEYLQNGEVVAVRGETGPYGQYTLFPELRADLQRIRFYDPYTHATGAESPADLGGGLYGVSRIYLYAVDDSQISDQDGDTLADEIEVIYGSNPQRADTDGDGFDDRQEVILGTDLLGRAIDVGEVVADELAVAGEVDRYTLAVQAGERLFADVQAGSGGGKDWSLVTPDGLEIFNEVFGGDPGTLALASGGNYTLIVTDSAGSATGPYQFQLWDVPSPDTFAIQVGDVISDGTPGPGAGRIETPGSTDVYTFVATAGQAIYFDVQSGSTGSIDWRLHDSFGQEIFVEVLRDREVTRLTAGGTYTLTVGADDNDHVGPYQFQLWDVPSPDTFAIQIGDVISDGAPSSGAGRIESPGVLDVYTFVATAGQRVFFDIQVGAAGAIDWTLVDSLDQVIFRSALIDRDIVELTVGGTYTLTVGAEDNDYFGIYQFQLWDVSPPQNFSIQVGDVISDGAPAPGAGNIESPGVLDVYTFVASAGQRVFFDVQAGSAGGIDWKLVDSLDQEIFRSALTDRDIVDLTTGGTYTLTVGAEDDDHFGIYQFQLWDVPPPQNFAIQIGDVISDGVPGPGAGNIESPGVLDIYTFVAGSGQTVSFDAQAGSAGGIDWRLVDSLGQEVFGGAFIDRDNVELTTGGTYTLTVGAEDDDHFGTYQFEVSVAD